MVRKIYRSIAEHPRVRQIGPGLSPGRPTTIRVESQPTRRQARSRVPHAVDHDLHVPPDGRYPNGQRATRMHHRGGSLRM